MITAISNFKTSNQNFNSTRSTASQKQKSQIAFAGNPLAFVKNESKVSGQLSRISEELTEGLSKAFRKLTGKDELPVVEKPLTANGKIIHPVGPDGGGTIEIPVPDKDIPIDGKVDGQGNIYRRTGDGTLNQAAPKNDAIAKEAENLIEKEVKGILPETEREIDHSKIVFDPNGMPILDVDGKPITEVSEKISNLDNHIIEHNTPGKSEEPSQDVIHGTQNLEHIEQGTTGTSEPDFNIDDYLYNKY